MFLFVASTVAQSIMFRHWIVPENPVIQCKHTPTNLGILRNMPSLREFHPASRGAAFHTVFASLKRARPDVYDHRTLVGDGSIVLDWAVAPSAKGIVVMFHGLAASSMGKKNMIRLCRRLKSAGFTAVVYNRSGHAPGTTPRPRGIRQGRN